MVEVGEEAVFASWDLRIEISHLLWFMYQERADFICGRSAEINKCLYKNVRSPTLTLWRPKADRTGLVKHKRNKSQIELNS